MYLHTLLIIPCRDVVSASKALKSFGYRQSFMKLCSYGDLIVDVEQPPVSNLGILNSCSYCSFLNAFTNWHENCKASIELVKHVNSKELSHGKLITEASSPGWLGPNNKRGKFTECRNLILLTKPLDVDTTIHLVSHMHQSHRWFLFIVHHLSH